MRQLQIPRGRQKLLSALERREDSDPSSKSRTDAEELLDESNTDKAHERRSRFKRAAAVLARLDTILSPLSRQRTIHEWLAAIDQLAHSVGLLSGESDDRDREAWDRFKEALAAGEQLETHWLNLSANGVSLDEFIAIIQEILSVECQSRIWDDVGKVRILAAQNLRGIGVPYLFLAGTSEKAFPAPSREDRVYSEEEYAVLNKAGLKFVSRRERLCDEMLLFYETVTQATRQLVVSYPALDSSAQPLLESPYVTELIRAFGPGVLNPTVDISLSPVPQRAHCYSIGELRLKAVSELLDEKPQRFASLLRSKNCDDSRLTAIANSIAPMLAGLKAVAARADHHAFGPLEGIFTSAQSKTLLSKRFGPEHCWSVSRLEEYAHCPFRFLATNVLSLEPLPELSLELDYGRRGQLAHEALAILHRRLNEAGTQRSPTQAGIEHCAKLSDETLSLLFESVPKGSPLEQAFRTIDFRMIADWMQLYFGQHAKYDEAAAAADTALRPAHFEVSFGLKRRKREAVDPLSTDKAFEICVEGQRLHLSGRIDRIDVGTAAGQVVFNIVDYKTGNRKRLKAADIEAGLALQLPLYALAVQELLMIDRRAVPWRVGYWYLKGKGFETHSLPQFFEPSESGIQETEHWQTLKSTLLSRVASLVRGIRTGVYPVYSRDDNCTSRCEYRTICRIGQVRSLNKVWPPPGDIGESKK